jgi:VWA domain-containing protein
MRLRRQPSAVPLSDLPGLRAAARRTRLVRIAIAVGLVCLLGAAVVTAGDTRGTRSDIVPAETTSVLVVDLSKSIIDTEFRRIGATLRSLIETDTPTGLVVFSDISYELLPPGSPASALIPVLRYFTPVRGSFPVNPWQATFRAGTQISTALELAHDMLLRRQVTNGSIVLISDLETAPSDFVMLTRALTRFRAQGVKVRVVPLQTTERGRNLFRSLIGPSYLLREPDVAQATPDRIRRSVTENLPLGLLGIAALMLLGLAANERWCARLALPWSDVGGTT